MACAILPGKLFGFVGTLNLPTTRGRYVLGCGQAVSLQRLASDSTGTIVCTFQGVIAGSEIRVFDTSGTELAGVETCDADHVLTWPTYAYGSSGNNVRVKVVNMLYKIKDLPYTAASGAQSLPIQQELDPWYSNP